MTRPRGGKRGATTSNPRGSGRGRGKALRAGPKLSESSESEEETNDPIIDKCPPTPGAGLIQQRDGSESDVSSVNVPLNGKRKPGRMMESARAKRINVAPSPARSNAESRVSKQRSRSRSSSSSSRSSSSSSASSSSSSSARSRSCSATSSSARSRSASPARSRSPSAARSRSPYPARSRSRSPEGRPITPEPTPKTPEYVSAFPEEPELNYVRPSTPLDNDDFMLPPTPRAPPPREITPPPPTPGVPRRQPRRKPREKTPEEEYIPPPTPDLDQFDMCPMTPGVGLKVELATPRTPGVPKRTRGRQPATSLQATDENQQLVVYQGPPTPKSHRTVAKKQLYPPGTIKSVTMVNIMSHARFQQTWHHNFNFVIGENGSGKSAILSAIVTGLGGKAYDTGRANSMKAIIKNGQTKARIEVVINNYYASQYGEEIRIIRSMSRDGGSRYQIKDSKKGLRGLNRHDLQLLLSKLNIQVDNPLAILHQEMSRNFLRTKDPQNLYGYFYRALLLGPCDSLLRRAFEDLNSANATLTAKEALLNELRNEENKLKKQVEVIESLQDVGVTLRNLDAEYAWAVVCELQGNIKKVQAEFKEAQRQLNDANQEKNKTLESVTELENAFKAYEQSWDSVNSALSNKAEECSAQQTEKHIKTVRCSECQGRESQINKQINAQSHQMKSLQNKIDHHQSSVKETYEQQKKQQDDKKIALEHDLTAAYERDHELAKEVSKLEIDNEANFKVESEKELKLRKLKKELEDKKQELNQSEKAKKTKYDVYGKEMSRLIDAVKQTSWRNQPRGPMGACFTVKQAEWAPLVEYILGTNLYGFLVDNTDDKKKLQKLIDQYYIRAPQSRKPQVTLMAFGDKRHDIRNKVSHCDFPSILDEIDIVDSDYVVYNWLIDTQRVERTVLFRNNDEACNFMKNRHRVPDHVQLGFSQQGFKFYPDPNYKAMTTHYNYDKPACRLLKVTQQQDFPLEDKIRGEIKMYELDIHNNYLQLQETKRLNSSDKAKMNEVQKQIRKCKIEQNRIRAELDILASTVCNIPDVNSWIDEIEDRKKTIAELTETKQGLSNQQRELRADIQAIDIIYKALQEEIRDLQNKLASFSENKRQTKQKIDELRKELNRKETVCSNYQRSLTDLNKKMKEAEKDLRTKESDAEKLGRRITNFSGSAREIKMKRDSLQEELQKNQAKIGQKDYITKGYEKAKDIADRVEKEINFIKECIEIATPCIEEQRRHFVTRTQDYGQAVRSKFRDLIKELNYAGDLKINTEEKTLVCWLSLDSSSKERAKTNFLSQKPGVTHNKKGIMDFAGGMSGGERSFTTLCLLCACWYVMDMPFYILDEFDVFMDNQNRKISQEILLKTAKSKPSAQFFIFSPQTLASAPPEDSLVLRLNPPKRQLNAGADDDGSEEGPSTRKRAIMG